MNIQIWNAFASNNSGSYTIVGSFGDPAQAQTVATELREVLGAHQAWFEAGGRRASPLDSFCVAKGIAIDHPVGHGDEWPAYGPPPTIGAVGSQVILHVPYTITMPRMIGEYFYRRGGRVDTELNHTHCPLVWIHDVWWPWQGRVQDEVAAARLALLDAAFTDDGPLSAGVPLTQSPSWTGSDHFMEGDLTLAVVWNDPVDGTRSLNALAVAHGARLHSRVIEAMREDDPAGIFRPSRPSVPRGVFDIVLRSIGPAPKEVVRRLSANLFGTEGNHASAVALVQAAPTTIVRAKSRDIADALVHEFEGSGATFEVIPHA